MSILTHDEAKRLSQSSTDPLEVIRNVEAAVIIKLAGSQNAPKDEIRLIWKPKCDALRQQLEAAQAEVKHLNLHLKATQSGRDAALARLAELPDTCDGKEQEAFEAYAVGEKLNMQCHPLHYLFLNGETYAARQGWKAAILYCRKQVDASAGASPQPKMVTPYITQEHFDKAFPVNVPPSREQPSAPSDTAITYMTGYSDGREWAQTSQALELSDDEIDALLILPFGTWNYYDGMTRSKLAAAPQPKETK